MKKLNFFLIIMLIVLLCTVLLLIQNNEQVTVKFLVFQFITTLGVFGFTLLVSGLLIMWIITLFVHYRELSKYKQLLKEKDEEIKNLEEKITAQQKPLENNSEQK